MVTRARVRQWLEKQFFLRIHMTLILTGTMLAGVVTTWLLMRAGINVLPLRYALAVGAAYLAFLGLVKLWLLYVNSGIDVDVDPIDALEFIPESGGPPLQAASVPDGGSLDIDFGDDLLFAIVLLLVVVVLGGLAIYFIYTAPVLLSEAAFEAILAASLARRAKKAEGLGWVGAVFRSTIVPFVGVLAVAVLVGWLVQQNCPDATRLRDLFTCGDTVP